MKGFVSVCCGCYSISGLPAHWKFKYAACVRRGYASRMASTQTTVFPPQNGVIERIFHVAENNSTISRELLGGLTTFMAMAYVVVVNPRILGEAGMPVDGVLFATCLSAAVATLVMGIWANYPIALAPGMSLNAYFTYSIVLGRHVPWQTALGVVFLSGSLFLILTLTNVREHIVNDIPDCLKHGTAAGIGFFIAFIGMRNANMIVANPATYRGDRKDCRSARAAGGAGADRDRDSDVAQSGRGDFDRDRADGGGGNTAETYELGRRICFRCRIRRERL